jgi:hypothetical protein
LITHALERARDLVRGMQTGLPVPGRIPAMVPDPGLPEPVMENCRLFSQGHPAVTAVVFPEVLGGALSTLVKCLMTAKISAAMRDAGVPSVPVICVQESGREMASRPLHFLDSQFRLHRISTHRVYDRADEQSVQDLISEIERIAGGHLGAPAIDLFRGLYQGATTGAAFCRLMSILLGRWGCVFVNLDSLDPGLPAPLFPAAAQVCDPEEAGLFPDAVHMLRPQVTLLDPRSRRFLEKSGLSVDDLRQGREVCLSRISNRQARGDALQSLDGLEDAVQRGTGELSDLAGSEPGLHDFIESARSKMLYQTGKLRERFLSSVQVRDEADRRQLDRTLDFILPEGCAQEGMLATAFFLLRYSVDLPALLYERLDPYGAARQIINVD